MCHIQKFSQEDLEHMQSGRLLCGPGGDQVQNLPEFCRWESNRHGNTIKRESKPDHGGCRRSGFMGSLVKAQAIQEPLEFAEMVDSCRIGASYAPKVGSLVIRRITS